MEEIKLGEYIRTEDGLLGEYCKYKGFDYIELKDKTLGIDIEKDIKKHSSNIIDLVEVGDYVNGKLVKHIADFEGVKEPIRKLIFVDEHRLVPGETAQNDEIKSIVTKEQFASVEYKLDN